MAGSRGLWAYEVEGGVANDVAWSWDGRWLAVACYPDFAVVLDGETGAVVKRFDGLPGSPVRALWLPHSRELVVVSSTESRGTIWDAAWNVVEPWPLHSGARPELAPDGRILAAGSDYPDHSSGAGLVALWDAATRAPLGELRGHAGPVRHVAWSPDSARLATASEDGTIAIWDVANRARIRVLDIHRSSSSLAWSRDGKTLVSGGVYPGLVLVDPEGGTAPRELAGHGWAVGVVEFPAIDGCFVSRDRSGLILIWNTAVWPWAPVSRWRPSERPRAPTAVGILAMHPHLPRLAQHTDDCDGIAVHELDPAVVAHAR